jgi:hypothetical protein
MNSYTIYTTYALVTTGNTAGYKRAIHCNYINTLQLETDNLSIQEVRLNFQNSNDFNFLSDNVATGYTAHRIFLIVQVVQNIDGIITKPDSTNWKYIDVTDQITGYVGGFLSKELIASVVYKMPLNNYDTYSTYDLDYLNYSSDGQNNLLSFGDETYFFGNVTTEIKADVYTLDLSIALSLNEFNSSTNLTWDGISKVYISEIGIFDENKNLVAIGKLNNPVPKDSTISRTLLFALDF